ncbi:MAG: hypothetical protein H8D78_01015 [Chloroflexi bacterium]|nr:hypothetical protein [Chloroflexota bacterium]
MTNAQMRIFCLENLTPDIPQVRDHFVFCLPQTKATCGTYSLLEEAEISYAGFSLNLSQTALYGLRNEVKQVGVGLYTWA